MLEPEKDKDGIKDNASQHIPRIPVINVDEVDLHPCSVIVPAITGCHTELVGLLHLIVHHLPEHHLTLGVDTELMTRQFSIFNTELNWSVTVPTIKEEKI